ncbi:MAG: group II truncated hemoglobin [Pseudomonadota bacterium]|nr:group II truncated hemoglobin [Pseudomonadota bacterium]
MAALNEHGYGVEDASYKAAGEYEGIERLVNDFYDFMETLEEARTIRDMHGDNLVESRKKLTYFLSGWLGGPKLFSQNYYPIRIPMAHKHLDVGEAERDAWMLCMKRAVALQPYAESFKEYLIEQLFVPAERIRMACAKS